MEFDLENPLTSFKEHQSDTIPSLFANESDHMPSSNTFKSDHLRFSIRRQAISLILQEHFSSEYDPFIPYLAINYIDRFISKHQISKAEPWIAKLLVVSCFSLAAKIKNTHLPHFNLQRDEGFVFDEQSIRRMELLILTSLNWRMRSITPFSFLHFFISLFDLNDPSSSKALKDRAAEILFKSQYEIKFLEYKQSIMAASALLRACQELFPMQFQSLRAGISACEHVNQENLLKCLDTLEDTMIDWYISKNDAASSCTRTPISILDHHCTSTPSQRKANSDGESSNIKRRKLNDFYQFNMSKTQWC